MERVPNVPRRYALIGIGRMDSVKAVAAYLPDNYRVEGETSHGVVISGIDAYGWTLDSYVLPRLASSGTMGGREIDLSHPALKEVPV